jgi:dihydrofolate reductase
MRIELVVAMDEKRVIGRDNTLPWHIPEDLKFFKRVTMGKPMLMGRRTFEAIGRALPGRDSIVLTRQADFAAEGVLVVADLDQALDQARSCAAARRADALMVIGGAQIFAETLPIADIIHLTRIHAAFAGDTFFPAFDEGSWRETWREAHPAAEHYPAFTFARLERST